MRRDEIHQLLDEIDAKGCSIEEAVELGIVKGYTADDLREIQRKREAGPIGGL